MGDGGSGPADLAYSILLDYFDVKRGEILDGENADAATAWRYHQDFKRGFIAPHKDKTTIASSQIALWLEQQEA